MSRLNDRVNRFDVFHADQFLVQSAVEVRQVVRVKAHLLQDGRMQVLHMHGIFGSNGTEFVGRAMADATLDPTTGHPHGESKRVVVAAGALGVFGRRLATKLTTPDNECLVEQTGPFQIRQESRHRLVGRASVQVVVALEVAVRIPVSVVVSPTTVELDEANSPLN